MVAFHLKPEHAAIAQQVIAEWESVPAFTTLADKLLAEQAITACYARVGLEAPIVTWQISILAAIRYIVKKYLNGDTPTSWDFEELWGASSLGMFDRVELATADLYTRLGLLNKAEVAPLLSLTSRVNIWWALRSEAVVVGNWDRVIRDQFGRIHNLIGPAIVNLCDDSEIFAIENCYVPKHVVMEPDKITVEEIRKQTNVEARRVWIRQMGLKRFLRETKAEQIDMDGGLAGPGGAPRALIQDCYGDRWLLVTDGSTSRMYYLAVPRIAKTCQEAHQMISGLVDETVIKGEC